MASNDKKILKKFQYPPPLVGQVVFDNVQIRHPRTILLHDLYAITVADAFPALFLSSVQKEFADGGCVNNYEPTVGTISEDSTGAGPGAAVAGAAPKADAVDAAALHKIDDVAPYFQRVSISGEENHTGVRKEVFDYHGYNMFAVTAVDDQ